MYLHVFSKVAVLWALRATVVGRSKAWLIQEQPNWYTLCDSSASNNSSSTTCQQENIKIEYLYYRPHYCHKTLNDNYAGTLRYHHVRANEWAARLPDLQMKALLHPTTDNTDAFHWFLWRKTKNLITVTHLEYGRAVSHED